jgi:hypothetical protein
MRTEIPLRLLVIGIMVILVLSSSGALVMHYYMSDVRFPDFVNDDQKQGLLSESGANAVLEDALYDKTSNKQKDNNESNNVVSLLDSLGYYYDFPEAIDVKTDTTDIYEAITIIREKSPILVRDLPKTINLSTPELAYASINRTIAQGKKGQWTLVSLKRHLDIVDTLGTEITKEEADIFLNASILEVLFSGNSLAGVIAILPTQDQPFDLRWLEKEDGEWRNLGEDRKNTIEEARQAFESGVTVQ